MDHVTIIAWILLLTAFSITLYTAFSALGFIAKHLLPLLAISSPSASAEMAFENTMGMDWYPPKTTPISNLSAVVNGTGVFGFSFDGSRPGSNDYYGGYNYCNMPHVNQQSYVKPPGDYVLEYVEVIHRHHKRTPYAANIFPEEPFTWDCDDEAAFHYAKQMNPDGYDSSSTYWSVYTSPSNPFTPSGSGTCQLPQITRGGLDDSWQHGKDLYAVYHDLLGFLPDDPGTSVSYRVTNNPITSQVVGEVVNAMYKAGDFSVAIQPASVDSLEPGYSCPSANTLRADFGVGSHNPDWTAHLTASQPLFNYLDALTGVSSSEFGFHQSWDHYFDNLSSRLCHGKPLPCSIANPSNCVNQTIANAVLRMGEYEYNYLYRSAPQSLSASTAAYGVWIAELNQNIRDRLDGKSAVMYRHNVAHDGSLSMLLSVLQVDEMVWPGMGAEVVFEVYATNGEKFIRVLWGGQVLRSSNPILGTVNMLSLNTLLSYFDDLVGVGARKVPAMCNGDG